MQGILIVGAGGHAKVVAEVARLAGFEVTGFLDTVNPERRGERFAGSLILGGESVLGEHASKGVVCVVAVGDNGARLRLAAKVESAGLRFATVVHPSATVSGSASVGEGTVILAGAVVNPDAKICRHVIVNTGASVDHDCVIEDGVHLSPGVHLGGRVALEREVWLGVGVSVKDGIRVGARTIIGVGAAVVADVPPGVVAFGVPASVWKEMK